MSDEKLNFTTGQIRKIKSAIRNKKPLRLNLKSNQLNGQHAVSIQHDSLKKLNKARQNGSGCAVTMSTEDLERMGKGMYMFGQTARGNFKKITPKQTIMYRPQIDEATSQISTTDMSKPTIEKNIKDGDGMRMFGQGMTMFGQGFGGCTNNTGLGINMFGKGTIPNLESSNIRSQSSGLSSLVRYPQSFF